MSTVVRERGIWRCLFEVDDYLGDWTPGAEAIAHVEFENALQYGGVSMLFQQMIGNGTATAGQTLTYLNSTQAAIGAGDSTTAVAPTHTDLQAATNKLRKAMDSTYPQHTDGTTSANNTITFRSTFATTDANFDWQEVAIFNSTTNGVGRMLNRKTQAIGVKTSAVSRIVTATVSIS